MLITPVLQMRQLERQLGQQVGRSPAGPASLTPRWSGPAQGGSVHALSRAPMSRRPGREPSAAGLMETLAQHAVPAPEPPFIYVVFVEPPLGAGPVPGPGDGRGPQPLGAPREWGCARRGGKPCIPGGGEPHRPHGSPGSGPKTLSPSYPQRQARHQAHWAPSVVTGMNSEGPESRLRERD